MRPNSNHYAFDTRFEESVFSGDDAVRSEALDGLIEDYPRAFQERRSYAERRVGFSDQSIDDSSIEVAQQNFASRPEIDALVAPFSKRIPDRLSGLKQRSFTPISEWEGYVESIRENEFTLRLVNVRSKTELADEEATFSITELSGTQRAKLELGAIVRWVVGLERLPSDQRRRVSELHFRRLPAHTEKDFQRSSEKAKKLIESVNWDEPT